MPIRRFTDAEKTAIRAMHEAGVGPFRIAIQFNASHSSIEYFLGLGDTIEQTRARVRRNRAKARAGTISRDELMRRISANV